MGVVKSPLRCPELPQGAGSAPPSPAHQASWGTKEEGEMGPARGLEKGLRDLEEGRSRMQGKWMRKWRGGLKDGPRPPTV